jgi:ParB family chromosome partitioning protein
MSTLAHDILAGARSGFGAGITRAGTVAENVFRIPVGQIEPDPENARQHFDAEELQALADNMKRHGQLQNAVAWLRGDGRYQLVAGERRLRAAKLAGIPTLNVLVLPRGMAEETRQEMAFAENMARSELKPTEVARHWKTLMERWGISGRELAIRIGVAPSTVSKRMALLKTDADTQRAVDAGAVKQTHVVESSRRSRRATKGRAPRGVFELTAGTLKLRRGYTLAQAVAELAGIVNAQAQADTTTEGREAA